ncbi:MAG: hypothetical protein KH074_05705 [Faecalibacterium prausnitzii]|nr:hypothetical protein [Faecalibacterium prausnitzii]
MKPVKKILALILAGVMALALLTGCGKAASPDRAAAEGVADWIKYTCSQAGNKNEISVSYQVPELSRNIAPLFDTNWMSTDDDDNSPNENAVISGTNTTVKQTLQQCLSNYKDASCTLFYATDVTDLTNFASLEMLQLVTDSNPVAVFKPLSNDVAKSVTHLRIAATHKTIGEQTFLLAVVILEA